MLFSMRKPLIYLLSSLLFAIIFIIGCQWYNTKPLLLQKNIADTEPITWANLQTTTAPTTAAADYSYPNNYTAGNTDDPAKPTQPPADFIGVAERAMPAAVHIKTKIFAPKNNLFGNSTNNFWNYDFFGEKKPNENTPPPQKDFASGSGVIVRPDGYIITNHHVIEDADEIEVILNDKRAFKAQIRGVDRSTDLAVLKIDAPDLTALPFGNSDNVRVGEWVMAVGNPFRLSSTVTTGIVSAKARNIDILEDKMAIESFIQTDAAVNPGNSGGALVNLKGELIGINTAIATPTGYYAGYSFAVPANIARKVAADIIREGSVKRGFLGVSVRDIDQELASELNLKHIQGVYVARISPQGAAHEAGIAVNDVITHIANISVNSAPELQEVIGRYHPEDVIDITLIRANEVYQVKVTLKESP